jgi:hypothetical protein
MSLFDGRVTVSIAVLSGQWTVQVDDHLKGVKPKKPTAMLSLQRLSRRLRLRPKKLREGWGRETGSYRFQNYAQANTVHEKILCFTPTVHGSTGESKTSTQ